MIELGDLVVPARQRFEVLEVRKYRLRLDISLERESCDQILWEGCTGIVVDSRPVSEWDGRCLIRILTPRGAGWCYSGEVDKINLD